MSEHGNDTGLDPRTTTTPTPPAPQAPPAPPQPARAPAPPRPARRTVLAAGAGTGAAALLGGLASAGPAPASAKAPEPAAGLAPYASYWYPDSLPQGAPEPGIVWRSLKNWRPEADPDLAHNTATVPLARRFTPVPPHPGAQAGQARIASLVSFGPTAGNPSQGSASADSYALTHWAYLDELVFWGGSSGEGLVLAPNAPVTDAAHRNGVRVMGNVFLPPVAYGGDLRWTRDLVQRDASGRFPIADKLVQVARTYGFDGWFVNAETDGGDSELASQMREFLRALRTEGAAHGLRTTWYDAMDSTGRVRWQGALNALNQEFFEDRSGPVADTMFVDFRWTPQSLAASGDLAERLGRSRHELWAAVDTEANGWNSVVDWEAIVPRGRRHVVSYGFYRPEWTRNHLDDRSPEAFHRADDRFWTGESLDPSRPAPEGTWRAPATVVADRSTVASLPFACAFNTGHGHRWYEEGRVTSPAPWSHLGLQDRLPGRRWVVDTAGERPDVSLDFDRAWRGGSSLLVAGPLDGPAVVGLHGTRLPLGRSTVLELVHATEAGGPLVVEAGVATREPAAPGAPVPYTWLPVGKPLAEGADKGGGGGEGADEDAAEAGAGDGGPGWRTARFRLGSLAGRTAYALAVRITGRGRTPVAWRLGALSVRDAGRARPPAPPAALVVESAARREGGAELRLSWRRAPGPVRHYEVSRVLPDGARRFLGGTCAAALHLPDLPRAGRERAAVLEVRAVDELYATSAPARTAFAW